MSRIGRLPIQVPAGVQVNLEGTAVQVSGPLGELAQTFPEAMKITLEDATLTVERPSDSSTHRALHGMTRALLNNMVVGVSTGFTRILEVEGVGYRAEIKGTSLVLHVGYSHPITVEPPAGIKFEVDSRGREVTISGRDKQAIGQVAANLRGIRPPEPYKGKGIRYKGETVRLKAGKSGSKGGKK